MSRKNANSTNATERLIPPISIYLPDQLRRRVDECARRDGRPRAQMIRRMVEQWLEQHATVGTK